MDIPADFDVGNGQTQKIGGATVFLPDAEYVTTGGGNINGDGSNNTNNGDTNTDADNTGGNGEPLLSARRVVGVVLLLALLILVYMVINFARRCG